MSIRPLCNMPQFIEFTYILKLILTRMASILPTEIVQKNLKIILEQIKAVVQRVKCIQSPRLVAVGKTFPAELTEACYFAGHRHFGENYVQELEEKAIELAEKCSEIKWHYIGKVQSNKVSLFYAAHFILQHIDQENLWNSKFVVYRNN